ncbi:TetR/AcrR family transcriptional regulator [Kribbella deserti]|uniref:TetR/AcrR family transcriptional regulator n=1 Tax=Kribbella deserti TaxID=1926257 RepID=A0ABV6QYX2_9ACTN
MATIEYFAEHSIGDASLRAIATGIGSSHRMLIYHFGSRDGLLAEVVRAVEAQQRETLAILAVDPDAPLLDQSTRFWNEVVEATLTYAPLYFELSAQAMQRNPAPSPCGPT